MPNPIAAIYENGILKPLEPLALREHQRVQINILVADAPARPDLTRVRRIEEQADAWLAQQPAHAVREPAPFATGEKESLDAEFDKLLSELHRKTVDLTEDELTNRINVAVASIRNG
jgi:predicted DNA-binding antitoxin AbrB/MazE fold protein